MAKKIYRSTKGQEINFDLLARENQNVVAVGNANLNARGDRLGPGGKIIETAEEILQKSAVQQAADPTTSYDQSNPNAVKMVSIKNNVNMATAYEESPARVNVDELKTPAQVVEEIEAQAKSAKEKETVKKQESKRKIVDKED